MEINNKNITVEHLFKSIKGQYIYECSLIGDSEVLLVSERDFMQV
jgi:hypothetical protein